MTASKDMAGPDGAMVRAYRRTVGQVRAGDWLPEHGAHVIAAPVADPEDASVWVALDTGADLQLRTRRVWLWRRYSAPAWMANAVTAYRAACDARNLARESSAPIPAGAVAGAAGSLVSWCQLEDDDFRAAYPAPRLADFIRDAAAAHRAPEDDPRVITAGDLAELRTGAGTPRVERMSVCTGCGRDIIEPHPVAMAGYWQTADARAGACSASTDVHHPDHTPRVRTPEGVES